TLLPHYSSVVVVPGVLNFTHVRNTGAAFGILNFTDFPFKTVVIAVIAAAALIGVGLYAASLAHHQRVARLGLALIIGGAAAYLAGLKFAMVRAKARGLDSVRVLDLGIYIIISALIGAKLLLLVTDFQSFRVNPHELLTLARSGGVFYGGLIVAVAVALWYIRRAWLPLWTTCDVFAPGIALGHAVGRFGCLFGRFWHGKPTTL